MAGRLSRCRTSFIRDPFITAAGLQLAAEIQLHHQLRQAIPASGEALLTPPAELAKRNLVIEVRGAGLRRTATLLAGVLRVTITEHYGQLSVRDASGAPLPRAYVKVYACDPAGRTELFKDGYTDLRGRFDYATVSGNKLDTISRFGILILDDTHGAQFRDVAPPAR